MNREKAHNDVLKAFGSSEPSREYDCGDIRIDGDRGAVPVSLDWCDRYFGVESYAYFTGFASYQYLCVEIDGEEEYVSLGFLGSSLLIEDRFDKIFAVFEELTLRNSSKGQSLR